MTAPDRNASLSVGKKILFALFPALVLLGSAELIIRWTGAARECSDRLNASIGIGRCHPILGYTGFPGRTMKLVGQSYNQAGFRSREFGPKPTGVYRILSLGDSCTFGMTAFKAGFVAQTPYPQRLEEIAAARLGPGKVEALNAGMGGYNSFQGLMLLRTVARGLEPDLITVRFGWNDHFMSRRSDWLREPSTRVGLAVQDLLLRTATYRFALRLGQELRALNVPVARRLPTQWRPTVSIEEFRRNLIRIVEVGTGMGARVWLLTAPDPFSSNEILRRYERLPADSDVRLAIKLHALPSFRKLRDIHREYAQVVREVAAEMRVPLVDMAAIYSEHATPGLFSLEDPVHPMQKGYDLEAEVLYDRLVSEGLIGGPAS